MSGCPKQHAVKAWAMRGSKEPVDLEVQRHAAECPMCAQLVNEVERVRRLASQLPEAKLSRERAEAIRFELMAETRRPSSAPARKTRLTNQRMLLAAIVACTAAVVVALLSFRTSPLQAEPSMSQLAHNHLDSCSFAVRAAVEPGSGAVVVMSTPWPRAEYVVSAGYVHFDVCPLRPDEHLRVVAGEDLIEVRGTKFGVTVRDGAFDGVVVEEGAIALRVGGRSAMAVTAGQSWTRDAEPAAETHPARAHSALPASTPARAHGALPAWRASEGDFGAFDRRFAAAKALYQRGDAQSAAALFDALASESGADASRRADALYWSARAHEAAGDEAVARERARAVAKEDAGAWHADEAALLAAELSLKAGNLDEACALLRRAAKSSRAATRERAASLLGSCE